MQYNEICTFLQQRPCLGVWKFEEHISKADPFFAVGRILLDGTGKESIHNSRRFSATIGVVKANINQMKPVFSIQQSCTNLKLLERFFEAICFAFF